MEYIFCICQINPLKVQCEDTKQVEKKLPPPSIYFTGIVSDDGKKATCLDYKARWENYLQSSRKGMNLSVHMSLRYCCKSTKMWRPTGLDRVEMLMPFRCPLGPIFTNITEVEHLLADINSQPLNPQDRKQATLEIFPVAGTTKKEQCSKIDIR